MYFNSAAGNLTATVSCIPPLPCPDTAYAPFIPSTIPGVITTTTSDTAAKRVLPSLGWRKAAFSPCMARRPSCALDDGRDGVCILFSLRGGWTTPSRDVCLFVQLTACPPFAVSTAVVRDCGWSSTTVWSPSGAAGGEEGGMGGEKDKWMWVRCSPPSRVVCESIDR